MPSTIKRETHKTVKNIFNFLKLHWRLIEVFRYFTSADCENTLLLVQLCIQRKSKSCRYYISITLSIRVLRYCLSVVCIISDMFRLIILLHSSLCQASLYTVWWLWSTAVHQIIIIAFLWEPCISKKSAFNKLRQTACSQLCDDVFFFLLLLFFCFVFCFFCWLVALCHTM